MNKRTYAATAVPSLPVGLTLEQLVAALSTITLRLLAEWDGEIPWLSARSRAFGDESFGGCLNAVAEIKVLDLGVEGPQIIVGWSVTHTPIGLAGTANPLTEPGALTDQMIRQLPFQVISLVGKEHLSGVVRFIIERPVFVAPGVTLKMLVDDLVAGTLTLLPTVPTENEPQFNWYTNSPYTGTVTPAGGGADIETTVFLKLTHTGKLVALWAAMDGGRELLRGHMGLIPSLVADSELKITGGMGTDDFVNAITLELKRTS